ncbi:hypothetical protein Tco_1241641 [Tanacetum coccineum]
MEQKCVTTKQLWKTHNQVNQVLHQGVSQLAEQVTEELIENNLKPCIAATILEDRDAFFYPTTITSTETTSSADLQQQLYFKMKRSLQDRANDPALWEVLKCKFEKSSTSNTSCRKDEIHSHHDDHKEDDAPPEGEKRVKRHKASKSSKSARGSSSKHSTKDSMTYVSKQQQQQQQEWDAQVEDIVIDEDEVIPEEETPEQITELQDVDKHVPIIFDYERIRATLNDALNSLGKQIRGYIRRVPRPLIFFGPQRNPNEPPRITEVVRITTDQPHGLDFMEQIIVMRENDRPNSFSKANFKYLNKNDIEDLYYLCRNKKVNYRETKLMNSLITFIKSRVIWERVHDFQLGIKSYQIKINLIAPTLTFPGIEAHEPYSIVHKPFTGLIYLNNKDEKQVMYLTEIVKFCDATLEIRIMEKTTFCLVN